MIRAITASSPSTATKTAEIMSRYRPIAPKPESSTDPDVSLDQSQRIEQSPYLRNVWAHLQARPTRTRKRARGVLPPPPAAKRACPGPLSGFTPPYFVNPRLPLPSLLKPPQINLPLLLPQMVPQTVQPNKLIDLNREVEVPEEKDLIKQLEGPVGTDRVIAPQPVRPVGSSITVGSIREEPDSSSHPGSGRVAKKEVEEEMELEKLPAVVSDSGNRVRLANSAYR